jgi:ABC-type multidrug transport system fused ATPase/permease subunit
VKNKSKIKAIDEYLNSLYVGKFEAFIVIFFVCLYAVAEFGGIGMLAPILHYISEGPAAVQSGDLSLIWKILLVITDFLRIPLNLLSLLILAFIPVLLRQLFYYLRQYYSTKIRYRAIARIRTECTTQILKADMEFYLRQGQGNLISAITIEAQRAGNIIYQFLNLLSSIVLISMYTFLLLIIQPVLAIISAAAFSGTFLIAIPFIRRSRRYSKEISEGSTNMFKQVADKIYGIRLIKMLSQEKKDSRKIEDTINNIADSMGKAELAGAKIQTFTEPVVILTLLTVFYIAVSFMGMNLTNLGVFFFVLYRTVPHIKGINTQWQGVNANLHSFEYVKDIVREAKKSRCITSGAISFEGLKNEIVFKNVSFSYDGDSSNVFVLKDLNLSIPKGGFIAIAGNSGAGKSTLVDLIPRLRDTTKGHILIDGTPIKEFDLKSLRSRIGFLTQEPFLFNDTVFNNITYGLQGKINKKDVDSATKKAYAYDFIQNMPQKYATVLGDRGTRLSGGQRQRLALARLILQDPDIIILDEYTSALDSESEKYIQEAMNKISKNRTMIVIAHRLATIKEADEILLLDGGLVVERGQFSTLIRNQKGRFRQLFEAQLTII